MKEALSKAVRASESEIRMAAGLLAELGWAEGNAGNFSIRYEGAMKPRGKAVPLSRPYPELEGRLLLLTVAGSRMRDVAKYPLLNLCLVKIVGGGREYILESGGGKPTSEFASHLAAHAAMVTARPGERVFLHTHPTHLLALSHLVKNPQKLHDILLRMFPESALALNKNLAVLGYLTPGSEELAEASMEVLLKARGVVWSGHGMAATGKCLGSAVDIIEIADKAARIALLMGEKMGSNGLSQRELKELYRAFES